MTTKPTIYAKIKHPVENLTITIRATNDKDDVDPAFPFSVYVGRQYTNAVTTFDAAMSYAAQGAISQYRYLLRCGR